ncbi:MAG: GatB/YqeY domain-containing protein [Flavobacteriales bacterium TMED84]|nr:MAG: GatB/YqeY domain-containing protein [Flavobacteriales bacterium TMED84]|tara:strand:- start:11092 stop:11547 length:456 start_codon:yes stop_codon:yes gene_type:complete
MSIQEKINNEIKLSMKEKNVDKLAALRSVKSAMLLELTKDGKTNMSDEIAIQIISKLVKQRKESASIFKSKNRVDLEKEELAQIKYLVVYLPKQLSEDEIEERIKIKLNEIDNVSLKDMGRLMGLLMKEFSGKADGKMISMILKKRLSEKD